MTRLVSLFAGIGGFELAGKQVGMTPTVACEIDPNAARVLDTHFPDAELWGDVATLDGFRRAEVMTAGSPCQDFSIAGLRKGLAGSRSGLFEHVIRLRDELRPRFVVWENVPGALTSNKGQDFANVIGALVGSDEPLPLPKHPSGRRSRYAGVAHGPAGTLAWRVLDAQHFGVPQRRQRIIAVLDTQGWASIKVLFPDYVEGVDHGQAPRVIRGSAWAMPIDVDSIDLDTGMAPPEPIKTRLADILEQDVDERYYLSQKACIGILRRANKRGRTLPEILDYALRCQAGEDVGEPPAYEALCVTGEITHCLKADGFDGSEDGTGRGQPIVPEVASTLQGGGDRGYRIGAEDAAGGHLVPEVARPLMGSDGYRSDAETETLVPVLMKQREGKPGGGKGPLLSPDLSPDLSLTLATGNDQFLFEPAYGLNGTQDPIHLVDTALPLESRNAPYSGGSQTTPLYRVRRLTPVECERLQGFPDGWTDIEGAKDSHRYRQLGNAVAVPVATWVLNLIQEQL